MKPSSVPSAIQVMKQFPGSTLRIPVSSTLQALQLINELDLGLEGSYRMKEGKLYVYVEERCPTRSTPTPT